MFGFSFGVESSCNGSMIRSFSVLELVSVWSTALILHLRDLLAEEELQLG